MSQDTPKPPVTFVPPSSPSTQHPVDVSLAAQIERNKVANEQLIKDRLTNEKLIENEPGVMFTDSEVKDSPLLDRRSRSEQIMSILKTGGMDTQQAEKAHKLIMEL